MPTQSERRKHRIRKTPWLSLELAMFFIALFLTLVMAVSGLITLAGKLAGGEKAPGKTITTTSEPEEEVTQAPQPEVNPLTQYANDTGYAGQLYQQLDAHPEAAYVLRNLNLYPEEVLVFVTRFPEAMTFAAGYPDYLTTGIRQAVDLTGEVEKGTMPKLIQWDSRWGYNSYGEGMIGYSGCGPTCLSMVSIYLTGYHDNDPLSVATFAADNGYYTKGSGSAWSLMSNACINFGLTSQELPLDESKVIAAVEEGHPVILAMGPGIFTDNGHFIVVCGHTEEGFLIRDPNSPANTESVWEWSAIEDQIKNLWVFSAAE